MKKCAAILGLCSLSLASLGQTPAPGFQPVVGRTLYHQDDSRTEMVKDPNTREMTEMTYNTAGQLTVKKVFLLNEKAEPIQGNVYDGRGTLVARVQCLYDEFGRRKEDRLINLQGEVFQQVIHSYGADGKELAPKVVNLNAASPTLKPQALDYTQGGAPGLPAGTQPDNSRFAPPVVPANPGQPTPPASQPAAGQEKKPSFFKRLFKK
ncbi:hypothetical protein SAMN02745166_00220 [Prosthecobacter debontii]|uniref:YD repeat-containing protein n=2 Tax=Prosthecobacter debontii TaxID=48467 RepID=A0A1T4WHJ0_9BACT|nr:hypothetical protein SAMN02745166_00220 [Prosthecobacter debontii]